MADPGIGVYNIRQEIRRDNSADISLIKYVTAILKAIPEGRDERPDRLRSKAATPVQRPAVTIWDGARPVN